VLDTNKPDHKKDVEFFKKEPFMLVQEGASTKILSYGKIKEKKGEGS
jgi:hypothetical protein